MKNLVYTLALMMPFISWAQTHSETVAPVGIELDENKNGVILKLRDEDWNDTKHHFLVQKSIEIKGEKVITCEQEGQKNCNLSVDADLFSELIFDDLAMNSGAMSKAKIVYDIVDEDSVLLTIQPIKYFPKNIDIDIYNKDEKTVVLTIMDNQGLILKELTNTEGIQVKYVYKNPETCQASTKKIDLDGLVMIIEYENGRHEFLVYRDKTFKMLQYELKGKKLKLIKEEIIMDSLPDDLNVVMAKSQLCHPDEK